MEGLNCEMDLEGCKVVQFTVIHQFDPLRVIAIVRWGWVALKVRDGSITITPNRVIL